MARIMKKDAERLMANVPEENVFRCHDGRIFRNTQELKDGLQNMSDDIYVYHVNSEKNDFSKWVRDTVQDNKLASDLSKSTSRIMAAMRVEERLTFLQNKLA